MFLTPLLHRFHVIVRRDVGSKRFLIFFQSFWEFPDALWELLEAFWELLEGFWELRRTLFEQPSRVLGHLF